MIFLSYHFIILKYFKLKYLEELFITLKLLLLYITPKNQVYKLELFLI